MAKLHGLARRAVAEAIYEAVVASSGDWRRPHLGASLIGETCHRKLWYAFRWATAPGFDGRMLRLFRRGEVEESLVADDLRRAGMKVHTTDENAHQWRFEHSGGHFAGSIDGAVLGVPGAEKTWHLLEVKTSNDKRFKELSRDGVQKSNPKHYSQMQVYMHHMHLTRALYVCVNKNDEHIYTERVSYDKTHALACIAKAETVIGADIPLTRISDNPSWFECAYCEHRPHCQLFRPETIERNCRTCASSTPQPDGTWTCDHHGKTLSLADQKAGCSDHRLIPQMVQFELVEVNAETREIVYQDSAGTRYRDTGESLEILP